MNLPREWLRPSVQWSGGSARETWEPVLQAAQAAWSELELASVTEGVRESAIIHLEADDLARAGADASRMGLALSVLEHKDGSFRAVVHHPRLATAWHAAWDAGDHGAVGELLGFPDCCREFFAREWAGTSTRDLSFSMASVEGPWEANTMLRWLGVRLVPHLPCSGSCAHTVAQAIAFLEAGRRAGVDVASLETILRLPVTHDAANEVAIVSTPHFRFLAGADRGARRILARPSEDEPGTWADNGFVSQAAMDQAHAAVMRVVGPQARSGLDLGCGDGRLLWKLALGNGGERWAGVESDLGRVERGNRRHGPRVTVAAGKIQAADLGAACDVVLLMPGRLLEMELADADQVRAALRGQRLVVYAYGDWIDKHDGLQGLAERAGLSLVGDVASSPGAEAAEGAVR